MSKLIETAAMPIWYKTGCKNQTVAFRKEFDIPSGITSARIFIGSDTDFVLYVDGMEAGRGQYPDYPGTKTFNEITLPSPTAGKHTLAVLAWHSGETFFTGIATFASLTAWVECDGKIICATDESWKCSEHNGWRNGYLVKRTVQLTYSTIFEAGKFAADWMAPAFDDSSWSNAVKADGSFDIFRTRPIPACELEAPVRGKICACGSFTPPELTADDDTAAVRMQRANRYYTTELPANSGSDAGVFAIYDLGRESVGFIFFEVIAPAGTRIDYGHGEHLDDQHVRTEIEARRFADEYICQEGRNCHELLFHRVGARYIELHISTPLPGQEVKIVSCGLRPWTYTLPAAAEFTSNDALSQTLRAVSARTLHLCMHEHFEDCPWREQAMYAYDSRNQSLYGYYLWGNHDFVRSSYQLTADSFPRRDDKMLSICAPTDCTFTIPMFSMAWMTAAWENYLYSGERVLFDANREMAKKLMDATLETYDPATGLYKVTVALNCWNFYEWSPGLIGSIDGTSDDPVYHVLYNCYLLEAIRSYVNLLDEGEEKENWQKRSEALAAAVVANFYDRDMGCFKDTLDAGQPIDTRHEHSQFLTLALGLVSGSEAEKVFKSIQTGKMHYATLSCMPYLVNSMAEISPETREYMADKIRETYAAMIRRGATSMWETQSGADDFGKAGSLCHGWSSLPIYYQGRMQLGVLPLSPGFKTFQVKPYADKYTKCVSGSVPVPGGEIKISWQLREKGIALEVSAPAGMLCQIADYPECPVISAVVNGEKVR